MDDVAMPSTPMTGPARRRLDGGGPGEQQGPVDLTTYKAPATLAELMDDSSPKNRFMSLLNRRRLDSLKGRRL